MDMFGTTTVLKPPTEPEEANLLTVPETAPTGTPGQPAKKANETPAVGEPEETAAAETEIAVDEPAGVDDSDDAQTDKSDEDEEQDEDDEQDDDDEHDEDDAKEDGEKATPAASGSGKPENEKEPKKPRAPYEWGKCVTTIVVRIAPVEEGKQKVRVAVSTHEDPQEPPALSTFTTGVIPPKLGGEFLETLGLFIQQLVADTIQGLPDRAATWKINPEKSEEERKAPAYNATKRATPVKGKSGTGPKKPPTLVQKKDEGQSSLFG